MLVLSRKPGEKVRLGSDIIVSVIEVKGQRVRIGIEAPNDVAIVRSELQLDAIDISRFHATKPR